MILGPWTRFERRYFFKTWWALTIFYRFYSNAAQMPPSAIAGIMTLVYILQTYSRDVGEEVFLKAFGFWCVKIVLLEEISLFPSNYMVDEWWRVFTHSNHTSDYTTSLFGAILFYEKGNLFGTRENKSENVQ